MHVGGEYGRHFVRSDQIQQPAARRLGDVVVVPESGLVLVAQKRGQVQEEESREEDPAELFAVSDREKQLAGSPSTGGPIVVTNGDPEEPVMN